MHHRAKQRRHFPLASRLAFGLAVAAAVGCGEHDATAPDDPTADLVAEGPAGSPAADLGRAASATAPTVEVSAASASATRLPKSLFVDPKTGSDANDGSQLKPFKTLAKGLSLAISGDTMRLAGGLYSAASNGEKFTTSTRQVVVPAGVKIFGAPGNLFIILQGGPGDLIALKLGGTATLRNLHVNGFPTAVTASQGVQSFNGVLLDQSQVGLKLTGSAKTTLTTGTVFVRPGTGTLGASVAQQAQLVVDGGSISAGGPNCGTGANGVKLVDAARLTMKNGAVLTNIMGTPLEMRQVSRATLQGFAKIQRDFTGLPSCIALPGVNAFDSTSLTLRNAQIVNTFVGKSATGISWNSRGLVSLDSALVKNYGFAGLHSPGNLRLIASNTTFQLNGVGINVVDGPASSISLSFSAVSANVIGIHAPHVKLRRTLVTSNQQTGVLLSSASGNDLGLTTDLGRNLIAANSITGVAFDGKVTGGAVLSAVGNSWTPLTQGTDGSGRYSPMVVTGTTTNPPASGKNFTLPPNTKFQIQL